MGDLEETITVSGAAPMVDTQNVSQQSVFAREVTENLPVGSTVNLYATLIPGAVYGSGARPRTSAAARASFSRGSRFMAAAAATSSSSARACSSARWSRRGTG